MNLFRDYIMAGYPLLWLDTHEEHRALVTMVSAMSKVKEEYKLYTWDIVDGVRQIAIKDGLLGFGESIESTVDDGQSDPMLALQWLEKEAEENSLLFLKDFHPYMKKDPVLVRKMRNLIPQFKACGKVMSLISSQVDIPPELNKELTVIQFNLPTREELKIVLRGVAESAGANKALAEADQDALLDASLGMTSFEAENAFSVSLIEAKRFDPTIIRREKAAIVKKTRLLEVVNSHYTLDDIGGLENLKAWLAEKGDSFSNEAKEFGVESPKGALLVGVPGCGKSLTAKAVSSAWQRPLIRLDVGKVFGSYVGESEANMRKCLEIAEAIAPCLTKDTEILMADGSVETIGTLYEKYPEGGFEVIGYDEIRRVIIPIRVNKVTKRYCEENYKVSYSDGVSTGYSWNHLQPVMRNGTFQWISTCDLHEGDFIAVPLGPLEGISTDIRKYLPEKLRYYEVYGHKQVPYDQAGVIAWGNGGYTDSIIYKWPSEINEDLLYLCGLLKSDGSLGKRRIAFTNTNRVLCDKFSHLLWDLFGLEVSERYVPKEEVKKGGKNLPGLNQEIYQDYWVLHADSYLVAQILRNVLRHIRGLEANLIGAFLAGYIDGDGCILPDKYPRIVFCSKKKNIQNLLRDLLKRFGILPSKGTNAGIVISGEQCLQLKSIILYHPDKVKKLQKISVVHQRSDRVRVFPLGRFLTGMRESLGKKTNHFKSASSSEFHAWEHNQRPVPLNRILKLSEEIKGSSQVWYDRLMDYISSPVRWVRIESIKSIGHQEVYDLCCEGVHNFIANGILTHNCVLWIDELEKSFAGTKGNQAHETTEHVFQEFLTWLQEKKADVFLVATANSVESLPPELLRPGRIDVTFWVDLPDEVQRREIFEIHLKKRGRDPEMFKKDICEIMEVCNGFSGAEIEVWIKEALAKAWHRKNKDLQKQDLLDTAREMTPISRLMENDINRARQWAKNRGTKNASIVHEQKHTIQTTKNRKIQPSTGS